MTHERIIPFFFFLFLSVSVTTGFSQRPFQAVVSDAQSGEPLPGASAVVVGTNIGTTADAEGRIVLHNIPAGVQVIEFSFVGYASRVIKVTLPMEADAPVEILLSPSGEELEEIVIAATRSSRTIADLPTRVEVIAGEELEEKGNMKPGDIRMLLNESTGIQTQQTSATSANASIRIQGLDGRYTQILKDGFPLYAGFSGGLGLLQTPPLDLKQVEVIKGASSTLYGGGAIAGLVNLVSRVPQDESELRFMVNGTSAGGLDLSGFFGKKFEKLGLTVFASRNTSEPYDPADVGLTAIPEFERYALNPKLFLDVGTRTTVTAGLSFITEDRIGGDMEYIEGRVSSTDRYFERNESRRYSTQLSVSHRLPNEATINFRNSTNHFDRLIQVPDYTFDGVQNSTFSEVNYTKRTDLLEWVGGVNLWTDDFREATAAVAERRDYRQTTLGLFIQNTSRFSDKVSLESGLRGDYVVDYGFTMLPRISVLYRSGGYFTTRLGGGFGYKAPTIFTEETERVQYQSVRTVSPAENSLERSYGANWDFNFRIPIGPVSVNINHLFFYTHLKNPLALSMRPQGGYLLVNLPGYVDTRGMETNVKAEYGDFKLFVGYTYTDAKIHDGGVSVQQPLTARHRLNNVLMYEVEEKWKIGLEAYYFSRQRLSDGLWGREYWICGLMMEKLWNKFSVFLNFENFLDARQTRFDTIYTGPINDPVFRDIYAPVDGFVINGGMKLNL